MRFQREEEEFSEKMGESCGDIIKKIPYKVQSLICASNQINSHYRAVEELVYNALDAEATSIAIRINIQENSIQVIDNGCGVPRKDYKSIGHRHMTSKFIDLTTLKSAPNKYGFRGQALANIINVSKSVEVISRHETSEETCLKLFEYGTEKLINKCITRSSKGTTVKITGFLYNLSIQKNSKDILGNLQHIKTFLEHLSIIHCNVSLSLRDDSKNEIVFKIHKNRDINQTLSTLYNIERNNIQELKVEKNEYKVTAYIGKCDEIGKHLIFLNGKFVSNTSKLHNIVNNNLSKQFKLRGIQKSKMKYLNTEEESNWIPNKIPDYFIFIKCPYIDYDLSNSPKKSVLEFKDWNQIIKLLERLITFFHGDINIKKGNRVNENQACDKSESREKVKKIMEKILGNHSKKLRITHMHNTIKGKQAKRKINRKNTKKQPMKPTAEVRNRICKDNSKSTNNVVAINNSNQSYKIKESNSNKSPVTKKYSEANVTKSHLGTNIGKGFNLQFKKVSKNNESNIPQKKIIGKSIRIKRKPNINKDVIRKLGIKTDSVKKMCDKLERKTRKIMDQKHNKASNIFVHDNIVINNKRLLNISVRKQIDEMIVHNSDLNIPKIKLANDVNACENPKEKCIHVQSNYDLLQTILNSQQENSVHKRNEADKLNNCEHTAAIVSPAAVARAGNSSYPIDNADRAINIEPKNHFPDTMITFRKHQHISSRRDTENDSFHSHRHIQNEIRYDFHSKPRTFITKQSRDNFVVNDNVLKSNNFKKKNLSSGFSKQFKSHIKNLFKQTSTLFNLKKEIIGNTDESSYTIEFTETNSNRLVTKKDDTMINLAKNTRNSFDEIFPRPENHCNDISNNNTSSINTGTYVVHNVDDTIHNYENRLAHGTYTVEKTNEVINGIESPNLDFRLKNKIYDTMVVLPKNIRISIAEIFPQSENHQNNAGNNDHVFINGTDMPIVNSNDYTMNNDGNFHDTFTIKPTNEVINMESPNPEYRMNKNSQSNRNFIFISKSQEQDRNEQIMDPIDICEAIFHSNEILDKEFEVSFNEKQNILTNKHTTNFQEMHEESMYGSFYLKENEETPEDQNENAQRIYARNNINEASHYFIPNKYVTNKVNNINETIHTSPILTSRRSMNIGKTHIQKKNISTIVNESRLDGFNIMNRLCFLPKGLSPIFQNCQTKTACEYNLTEDCYEKEMYNNFADDVRNNAEIFVPKIQNAKKITTKAVDKVNAIPTNNNSVIKFDGQSLKCAKVLGQIDEKFIAATMKEERNVVSADYLILFDQHAVHERIRVENNLTDYLNENHWKSVKIDTLSLELSKDNVLYLHNFRDKFEQLGLLWTVTSSNEVSIRAIPEAILGKNPRQVETVMKAVKNLIVEEINIIKTQGGCVSLYPKSIMDLVFSEACRCAIKFGDKLSKSECVELLETLSSCKTPFQCAHGRPVMAVIMESKLNTVNYKVNFDKVGEWKRKYLIGC